MGLVEYTSDSDNDAPPSPVKRADQPVPSPLTSAVPERCEQREAMPPPGAARPPASPLLGPSLPERSLSPTTPAASDSPPASPYTANRNLIHTLTLPPTIPEIPPSPPGSPPLSLAKKFARFRELKAAGTHFNEKLLRSSALRNPNLLEKLTQYVGLERSDGYASNLPKEIWDPQGFPKEAFAPELAKAQAKAAEERMQARDRVDFVAAAATATPPTDEGAKGRTVESKAERVMKGLEREARSETPPARSGGKSDRGARDKTDEKRDGRREERSRWDDDRNRRRSRSRSRDRDKERSDRRYRDYKYRNRR